MAESRLEPLKSSDIAEAVPDAPSGLGASTPVVLMKRLAPWLIAGGILYYLFSEVPIVEATDAARSARLEIFLPVMFSVVLLWFLIDSAAFAFIFSRYNARLIWAEARSLRGITYLLTPINWNLGTAAVILHLRTSKKIGALDSTSTMFFYQTIDGMILGGFVLLGVQLLPDSPETLSLRNVALGFECIQVSILVVLMSKRPSWPRLQRVRSLGLFRTLRLATSRDLAVLFLLKSFYFGAWIGLFWFGCQAFGIDLPIYVAIAATPAVLMAGALPITPAGLGTQQAAMIYFFSPHGDEAAILAFGITFPVALILFRCVVGARYMSDLPKLRKAMAQQRAES
jgi:uncharacterized membrane protein YbhN (UPF0104 family)